MITVAPERIPLGTFAIGFGLAGLAEAWSTAGEAIGWSPIAGQGFWLIAAVAWVWLIAAHIRRGLHATDRLVDQLRHPAQGPIAALVPITGMLIGGDLIALSHRFAGSAGPTTRVAGVVLFLVMLAIAAPFAAWLIGQWLRGGLAVDSVHGGYLLPTVAAGFVGAAIAANAGMDELSFALFGVGTFFWVVITVVLVIRFALRPSLPDALVPTMAILVAPPAVAGIALFAESGTSIHPIALEIAGIGALLVLVQLGLIPKYRRLTFSLGFWSFTFPTAAVATDSIDWLRIAAPLGWQIVVVALLAVVTALVAFVAAKSLASVFHQPTRQAIGKAGITADRADTAHHE